MERIQKNSWKPWTHPHYGLDPGLFDYHLFRFVKDQIWCQQIVTNVGVQEAMHCFSRTAETEFWCKRISRLPEWWQKCIDCGGDFVEQWMQCTDLTCGVLIFVSVLDCEFNLLMTFGMACVLALPVFFLKFLSDVKSEDNDRVHGLVLCSFDTV